MPDVSAGRPTTYCPPRRAPRPASRRWRLAALAILALLLAWMRLG